MAGSGVSGINRATFHAHHPGGWTTSLHQPATDRSLMRPCLLICAVSAAILSAVHPRADSAIHPALSDREYWSLVAGFSEPGGSFRSENLVSNETHWAQMI